MGTSEKVNVLKWLNLNLSKRIKSLGINKQIEQEEVLPSAAVPNLDAAESRFAS